MMAPYSFSWLIGVQPGLVFYGTPHGLMLKLSFFDAETELLEEMEQ